MPIASDMIRSWIRLVGWYVIRRFHTYSWSDAHSRAAFRQHYGC